MIKMRTGKDDKDVAAAACEYIVDKGNAILENAERINEEDRSLVQMSIEKQEVDFKDLKKVLLHCDPRLSAAVYEIVTKLMIGSFIIGSASIFSKEAEDWKGEINTHMMRLKKSEKDMEAKRAAIKLIKETVGFHENPKVSADAIFSELKGQLSLATIKRRLAEIRHPAAQA